MAEHTQVELTTPEGSTIEVDQGMRRVLASLWRLGVKTLFSCQGDRDTCRGCGDRCPTCHHESDGHMAYIMFAESAGADAFISAVRQHCVRIPRSWRWDASTSEARDQPRCLRVCVRFPPSHIATVEQALATAARKTRRRRAA